MNCVPQGRKNGDCLQRVCAIIDVMMSLAAFEGDREMDLTFVAAIGPFLSLCKSHIMNLWFGIVVNIHSQVGLLYKKHWK